MKPKKGITTYWQQFNGLSKTFGTPHETAKDRAKREIMETMPPIRTNDEIIVIDPDAPFIVDEASSFFKAHTENTEQPL